VNIVIEWRNGWKKCDTMYPWAQKLTREFKLPARECQKKTVRWKRIGGFYDNQLVIITLPFESVISLFTRESD
jgi:hypothetical protein